MTTTSGSLLAGLDEIIKYMTDRADVVDGPYGEPEPNTEMKIESDLKRIRTAVAALIARNAELEAERNMLGQAIADAAHKGGITRVDAALDGPMLLMVCDDLATHADALAAENKAMRQTLEELTCAVAPMLEAEVCCEPITVVDPDPTARHGSVSTWSPYPLMSFRQEDMWELKRMHGIATAALARTPANGETNNAPD